MQTSDAGKNLATGGGDEAKTMWNIIIIANGISIHGAQQHFILYACQSVQTERGKQTKEKKEKENYLYASTGLELRRARARNS